MANFVDLMEINKKVIEGNLPGSLLGDIRSTQRSKIAQNRYFNNFKITYVSMAHFVDLGEINRKVLGATFQITPLG